MIRKYYNHKQQTTRWHREEEWLNHHKTPGRQLSKATSSLFSIKMIAILKWTQSNVQQNIEQLRLPHGSNNKQKVNNNRTTALEQTAA